jgi:hypothetical protein
MGEGAQNYIQYATTQPGPSLTLGMTRATSQP